MSDEKSLDRVRITVVANATHPDVLSVQDAMRQVLDFFDLLTPDADAQIVWNLKLASTNSPLTVEGEPYSIDPGINASAIAHREKAYVEESFRALAQGRSPSRRLSAKRRAAIKRIFDRNLNGIGKTEIILQKPSEPVFVTPKVAKISIEALDVAVKTDFDVLVSDARARNEEGTLDGVLIEIGTDYNRPAILIRERHTGQEVWCRLVGEVKNKISSQTTFNDVWSQRRVLASGRISYNPDGTIMRLWARDVTLLSPRVVSLETMADPDFTSGLSTTDYLERLREGGFG